VKRPVKAGVIAVIVVIAAAAGYLAYGIPNSHTSPQTLQQTSTSQASSTTNSNSTTHTTWTCSGYPPGGNCIAPYNYTFTVSVNYTGPWRLTYNGQTDVGEANAHYIMGNLTGTGYYSVPVMLSGLNNGFLTLCAQAQKLDGSNHTLVLTVTGSNQTSAPYGSTSYCGGVVP